MGAIPASILFCGKALTKKQISRTRGRLDHPPPSTKGRGRINSSKECLFVPLSYFSFSPSILLRLDRPFVAFTYFSRCEAPSAPSEAPRFSAPPVWRSRNAWALALEKMPPDKLWPALDRRRRKTAAMPRKFGRTLKIQPKRRIRRFTFFLNKLSKIRAFLAQA